MKEREGEVSLYRKRSAAFISHIEILFRQEPLVGLRTITCYKNKSHFIVAMTDRSSLVLMS